jgi:[acyl-carrier-protein] S-malonyltransferase
LQYKELAFIFPAFITESSGDIFIENEKLQERLGRYLEDPALPDLFPGIPGFSFRGSLLPAGEPDKQAVTFLYSCAVADHFRNAGLSPEYSAGYSMGLYSALCHAGVIGLAEGLALIRKAWEEIRNALPDTDSGMVSVVGLGKGDLELLVEKTGGRMEITNRNNPVAFIVSGSRETLAGFSEAAKQEGALHVRDMNVSFPYHSSLLRPAETPFREFVDDMTFREPAVKIVSCIDQSILDSEEKIRKELVRNLFSHLDWYRTQQFLLGSGILLFLETGAGNYLARNAKFIDGNYRFLSSYEFMLPGRDHLKTNPI